jgi:hypothetical protein
LGREKKKAYGSSNSGGGKQEEEEGAATSSSSVVLEFSQVPTRVFSFGFFFPPLYFFLGNTYLLGFVVLLRLEEVCWIFCCQIRFIYIYTYSFILCLQRGIGVVLGKEEKEEGSCVNSFCEISQRCWL